MKKANVKAVVVLAAAALCCGIPNAAVMADIPNDTGIISPKNIAIVATDNSLTLGALGKLSCYGATDVQYGYNAGVTVELQQDGTTIKTWSADDFAWAMVSEDYYVPSGHSYQLKLTHKAYDSNWNLVETIVKYSKTVFY